MQPNQLIAQENNTQTKSTPMINDAILNTPAEEKKPIQQELPNRAKDTFLQLNRPQNVRPKEDVTLTLDGKQLPVKDDSVSVDNKLETLQRILGGPGYNEGKTVNATAIFVIIAVIIGLVVVVIMSQKRSEYILRLEKELDDIKKDR